MNSPATKERVVVLQDIGKCYRQLIADMQKIHDICENSNPTYRTRVAQILAITNKWGTAMTLEKYLGPSELSVKITDEAIAEQRKDKE